MSTPNRLKDARLAKGMSMMQLTAECGVSSRTISGIERHGYEPSVGVKARLAEALGVSITDLWPIQDLSQGLVDEADAEGEASGETRLPPPGTAQ